MTTVDEKKWMELKRVSSNIHYQIAQNFDEADAEGTITALVEKYPNLVMKILSQKFIDNLTMLETINDFMKSWNN